MNLYHLKYFVTLANLEHYTKAAEQLNITQPSLSHAIASLEKDLKVKLFEKDGRNVVLTKYGHLFLKDVEKVLAILDYSITNLQMTGTGEGTIDVAFVPSLGITYIPTLLRLFSNANPDKHIQFRLHNGAGTSESILEGLKMRKYDVAFCSKYHDDPQVHFVPVVSQPLVVITPIAHPLAEKEAVSLKETLSYPQIIFNRSSGLREIIDGMFERIDDYPKPILEARDEPTIAGLVAQNFGIAVVPLTQVLKTLPVRILEITDSNPERTFYMASLKDTYTAPLVEDFKHFVTTH